MDKGGQKVNRRSENDETALTHRTYLKKVVGRNGIGIGLPVIKIRKKNNFFTSYALKNSIFGVWRVKTQIVDMIAKKHDMHLSYIY